MYDINFENEPEIFYGLYLRMCNDLSIGNPFKDQKPKKPYNLLITNQWIAIIKSSSDHHLGYSINGLGFAGYILVTNRSDISFIREKGPEKLLESFV